MSELREKIRSIALDSGYDLVGFAGLTLAPADREHLERFVLSGAHADMDWFARTLQVRQDPARLFADARCALALGVYYRDETHEAALKTARVRISRYAVGRDYHRTLKQKGLRLLRRLQSELAEAAPGLDGRVTVDSAPAPEKILARMAGLGWQGKHTNLIHPELGSYFFLSILLLNVDLPPDQEAPDQCRECRLCLDACPTNALAPYRIDAARCLSYQTIERREPMPADLAQHARGWIFGCDICQEVCPYNRNRKARTRFTREADFRARPAPLALQESAVPPDESAWEELTRGSALRRPGRRKLLWNLEQALAGADEHGS